MTPDEFVEYVSKYLIWGEVNNDGDVVYDGVVVEYDEYSEDATEAYERFVITARHIKVNSL